MTLTIPDALLKALEDESRDTGNDRLRITREALAEYLVKKGRLPKSGSNAEKKKSGDKH